MRWLALLKLTERLRRDEDVEEVVQDSQSQIGSSQGVQLLDGKVSVVGHAEGGSGQGKVLESVHAGSLGTKVLQVRWRLVLLLLNRSGVASRRGIGEATSCQGRGVEVGQDGVDPEQWDYEQRDIRKSGDGGQCRADGVHAGEFFLKTKIVDLRKNGDGDWVPMMTGSSVLMGIRST